MAFCSPYYRYVCLYVCMYMYVCSRTDMCMYACICKFVQSTVCQSAILGITNETPSVHVACQTRDI